jgi:hypothetical protein
MSILSSLLDDVGSGGLVCVRRPLTSPTAERFFD